MTLLTQYYDQLFVYPDQALVSLLQSSCGSGGRMLDLGCGVGRSMSMLASQGFALTGIDSMPDMLLEAERRLHDHRDSIELILGDFSSIDLGCERFDGVYSFGNTLSMVLCRECRRALYARVHQALRPDGIFIFYVKSDVPSSVLHRTVCVSVPGGDLRMELNWYENAAQATRSYVVDLSLQQASSIQRERYVFVTEMMIATQTQEDVEQCGFVSLDLLGDLNLGPHLENSEWQVHVFRKR